MSQSQRQRIRPSPLVIRAYNGGLISNLGQISLDLHFDNGDTIRDQSFLVTSSNRTPLIGTNILLTENQKLVIDGKSNTVVIRGVSVQLHGRVPVGENELSVGSVVVSTSGEEQIVRAKQDFVIPAKSVAVIPAHIKLPPESSNFLLERNLTTRFSRGKRYILPVAMALFQADQYSSFPVKILNCSDADIVISKNSKLGKISPVSGEDCPEVTSNSLTSDPEPVTDRLHSIMEQVTVGDIGEEHRNRFLKIIDKYKKIILLEDEIPTPANVAKFQVFPKESAPVSSQSYRTPYAFRADMKKILEANVQKGVLERHSSPWNSPTLLVRKSNGSLRLVVDFRKVNANMKSDSYPLPRIPDLLTNLKNSRYFTSFDCTSGFHQVPLDENSKDILTIGNEFGQFRYNVMPMGFKNSPAHFQRVMDDLFRSVPQSELLVYIDDLLVHSPTIEENLTGIEKTLGLLASKNLQLKASKITALVKSVVFCGQHIENGSISIPESRVSAVRNQKSPRNKDEARSLFGFYNYLRNMIPNFAARASPITQTYRTGRFIWTEKAEKAFRDLQQTVISGTLSLAIPDTTKDILVVETDASEHSMAGCLFMCSQTPEHKVDVDFHNHDENCLRPVAFFSQNFKPGQMRQYIREKELRSFKTGLSLWRQYLLGREFIWRTDNKCNSYANEMKSSNEKVAKILAEVSEFTYRIQSRTSAQMKVSDHLSRGVNNLQISRPDFAALQSKDKILGLVYNFTKINLWPTDKSDRRLSKEVQYWRKHRLDLRLSSNGELVKLHGDRELLIVPSGMRTELIESYHDSQFHPGIENTMSTLGKHYIWYGMRDQVTSYVRSCEFCQRTKPNRKPQRPPMAHTDTPEEPFEKLSIDLTGPFPKTNRNNQWIVVINDHFSKRVYAKPIRNKEAATILHVLKDIIYSNPRLPRLVLSDNGREFSGIFKAWLEENGIQHYHSAPYHPATNGLTERSNQSIKARLRPKDNPTDWDLKLLPVIHAINLTPNEVTRHSPFEIENGMVGTNPNSPVQITPIPVDDLQRLRRAVHDVIEAEKKTRSRKFDRQFTPFVVGDEVLIKSRPSSSCKYFGPFKIESVYSNGRSYMVRNIEDQSQVFVRRVEEMKAYTRREEHLLTGYESLEVPESAPSLKEDDWLLLYPNSGNGWPKSSKRNILPAVVLGSPSRISPVTPASAPSASVPVAPVMRVVDDTALTAFETIPVQPASPENLESVPDLESAPATNISRENNTDVNSDDSSGVSVNEEDLPESNSDEIPEVQADLSQNRILDPIPDDQQPDATMMSVLPSPENKSQKRPLDLPENEPSKLPVLENSSGNAFLSRIALKNFINSKSGSSKLKQVPLNRITSPSDLRTVAKNFKVPLTLRDPDDMRKFILKKNPKIRTLRVAGVTWPIVQLGSGWELVQCPVYPNYYHPADQDYEQLLALSLKWKVPVTYNDLQSKESLCARIESFSKSGKLLKLELDGKIYFSGA